MDQNVALAQMDPRIVFYLTSLTVSYFTTLSIKIYFLLMRIWRLHLIRMLDWCLVVEVTIKDVENKFITA